MKKQAIKSMIPVWAVTVTAVLVLFLGAIGCIGTGPNTSAGTETSAVAAVSATDSDGDGIPDAAEQVLGTNPFLADTDGDGSDDASDEAPTMMDAQFQPSSGPEGFKIVETLVENNYDTVAKKDAPDHLELQLQSTATTDITDMVIYYTIFDLVDNRTESYLMPLDGFVLKAGETQSVHIDGIAGPNHFSANPSGLYATSTDELLFTVTVSADGYQSQQSDVKKDAGGAEAPD